MCIFSRFRQFRIQELKINTKNNKKNKYLFLKEPANIYKFKWFHNHYYKMNKHMKKYKN